MIFLGISIFLCPMRPRTAREEATFFFSNTFDTADGDPQMDSAQMRMRMLLPKKLYRAAGAQKLRRAPKLLSNVRQWVLQCSLKSVRFRTLSQLLFVHTLAFIHVCLRRCICPALYCSCSPPTLFALRINATN